MARSPSTTSSPACPRAWARSTTRWASSSSRSRAERVVATMPVEGNTQPYGLLHGGASVVLAETLGLDRLGDRTRARPALGRRRHQRHPPPLGADGHRHRRGDADPPRAHHGDVRGRHHRRAGQAGLHLAHHLRAGPGRTGLTHWRRGRARRDPQRPSARRAPVDLARAAWRARRPPGRRVKLARARRVVAARSVACGAEAEPGHEPVGVARAGDRAVERVRDAVLPRRSDRGLDERRPTPWRRKSGRTCGETASTAGSRLSGRAAAVGASRCMRAGDLGRRTRDHDRWSGSRSTSASPGQVGRSCSSVEPRRRMSLHSCTQRRQVLADGSAHGHRCPARRRRLLQ